MLRSTMTGDITLLVINAVVLVAYINRTGGWYIERSFRCTYALATFYFSFAPSPALICSVRTVA